MRTESGGKVCLSTRFVRPVVVVAGLLAAGAIGCTTPALRTGGADLKELMSQTKDVRLVGDMAGPWGFSPLRVESVALTIQLAGTGSDPAPGTYRTLLLNEMKSHNVEHPSKVLAGGDKSLVLLRGLIQPGAQKGDRFDIEVRLPPKSETKSLRNGWVMSSRMRDVAVIENELHQGHVLGLGQGAVLVDAALGGGSEGGGETTGRILGGGVVQSPRAIGVALASEYKSVQTAAAVAAAVNERFQQYDHGQKQGIATAKTDQLVQMEVPPRYRRNLDRFMQVVLSIPVRETPQEHHLRLEILQRKLFAPESAAVAAMGLEALSAEGQAVLRKGLTAEDESVRFYAAEALAYLDVAEAEDTLQAIVRQSPRFRESAAAALGAMEHDAAMEKLNELLQSPEDGVRLAAFRAIAPRSGQETDLRREMLGDQLMLTTVPSQSGELVYCSTQRRPELAIFGNSPKLSISVALSAGPNIIVKAVSGQRVRVSRFAVGEDDRVQETSSGLRDVVRTIVMLGGSYTDLIQFLQEAKKNHSLSGSLVIQGVEAEGAGEGKSGESAAASRGTSPGEATTEAATAGRSPPATSETSRKSPEKSATPGESFLGKMGSWAWGSR